MATKQPNEEPKTEPIKSDVALDSPKGLTEAAQLAFNAIAEGKLDAQQGNVLQKLIRGQAYMLGDLPLQYLRIIKDIDKGTSSGQPMGDVINGLERFLKADAPKQVGK